MCLTLLLSTWVEGRALHVSMWVLYIFRFIYALCQLQSLPTNGNTDELHISGCTHQISAFRIGHYCKRITHPLVRLWPCRPSTFLDVAPWIHLACHALILVTITHLLVLVIDSFNGKCCFRPWAICAPCQKIKLYTILSQSGMGSGARQHFVWRNGQQDSGKHMQWTHPNGACCGKICPQLHTFLTQGCVVDCFDQLWIAGSVDQGRSRCFCSCHKLAVSSIPLCCFWIVDSLSDPL